MHGQIEPHNITMIYHLVKYHDVYNFRHPFSLHVNFTTTVGQY